MLTSHTILSLRFDVDGTASPTRVVHYDGPGDDVPGAPGGGYGWEVRTKGLSSKLEAQPGQSVSGQGGRFADEQPLAAQVRPEQA